jgi:hypothetical protein
MSENYAEQFPTKFRGNQRMRSEKWRDREIVARKSWASTHEPKGAEKFPLNGHPNHHQKTRWKLFAYGSIIVVVFVIGTFALTMR